MISIEKNGLKIFQFLSLMAPEITQGVFSRQGGSSPKPWHSLNLGGTVGDDPQNIKSNLEALLSALSYSPAQLAQIRQIHSASVIYVDKPMNAELQGDAMITDKPNLLLLMRFADCVPILFFDPVQHAVGIAHAGWQGTIKEIPLNTVKAMGTHFGSDPANLLTAIGPSIGPDHYEIGDDVAREVKRVFPDHIGDILKSDGDGLKLDLWKANQISLNKAGVNQIEIAEICTGCQVNDWFSHRAENGKTGRFAAVIGLVDDNRYGN
ncbi:MAG: peptidoglycan editing factor PgeF [Anaerolineales bacterium]|nr:peptidoglycan editing factor PgeF [Anaerolineales bacterium]